MIERISSSRIAAPGVADARPARAAVPSGDADGRSTVAAASPLASEPRRIAAEGPPIDPARVERLRAAIAEGSFVIDPERIAAAMMAAERGA